MCAQFTAPNTDFGIYYRKLLKRKCCSLSEIVTDPKPPHEDVGSGKHATKRFGKEQHLRLTESFL